MGTTEEIREEHFRKFGKLSPEEQIIWALSQGYVLWELMPKENKLLAKQLRHGRRTLSKKRINYS